MKTSKSKKKKNQNKYLSLTRALQSNPFQNPGGVAQALRSPDGRTEILVSNIGLRQVFELCTAKFAQEIPGIPGQIFGLDIQFPPFSHPFIHPFAM